MMTNKGSNNKRYMLAVALGAIASGLIVAYATKAMPRMMAGMMHNMMALMGGEGCNPAEM